MAAQKKRPITEAAIRAKEKYRKKTFSVQVTFYPHDDLTDYIRTIGNKSGYIKSLIRQDRDRKKAEKEDL